MQDTAELYLDPIVRSEDRPLRPLPNHYPGEPRPFSLNPVFDYISPKGPRYVRGGKVCRADRSIAAVALRLGIGRKQVYRWLDQGLGVFVADAIAVRLKHHPVHFWPEWFAHAPDEENAQLACRVPSAGLAGDDQALVARVVELRGVGIAWRWIAQVMAAEGFKNPVTRRPWDRSTLRLVHESTAISQAS